MGFVGCNLNPDPSGGYFNAPPLTDKCWFPFYEKMIELDVPAMIHVSGCCNPAQHTTGSYYLNADTMAFMQLILSDLFKDFPKLKFIIPHGGGAVPFHWGRFRGIALNNGKPELAEIMANNLFFDTCVYHQPGIDLLTKVVPVDNILFASEMVGAVKGNDPRTGFGFDDTKRYVERHRAVGCRQDENLRGQRIIGLFAAEGPDRQAGSRPLTLAVRPRRFWATMTVAVWNPGARYETCCSADRDDSDGVAGRPGRRLGSGAGQSERADDRHEAGPHHRHHVNSQAHAEQGNRCCGSAARMPRAGQSRKRLAVEAAGLRQEMHVELT